MCSLIAGGTVAIVLLTHHFVRKERPIVAVVPAMTAAELWESEHSGVVLFAHVEVADAPDAMVEMARDFSNPRREIVKRVFMDRAFSSK